MTSTTDYIYPYFAVLRMMMLQLKHSRTQKQAQEFSLSVLIPADFRFLKKVQNFGAGR